jgi:hypothetical protein
MHYAACSGLRLGLIIMCYALSNAEMYMYDHQNVLVSQVHSYENQADFKNSAILASVFGLFAVVPSIHPSKVL